MNNFNSAENISEKGNLSNLKTKFLAMSTYVRICVCCVLKASKDFDYFDAILW
jgi:hypothetical protein